MDMEKGIPLLLGLLQMYNAEDKKHQKSVSSVSESEEQRTRYANIGKEMEDLLTKVIRVISNVALDVDRGKFMATSKEVSVLIELFERKDIESCEELVLNIVRCITNLSYYGCTSNTERTFLFKDHLRIAKRFAALLLHDHPDMVLESARAFGNLSRNEAVRQWIHDNRVDEILFVLLDHSHPEIVEAACGTLINLTHTADVLPCIIRCDSIHRLLDIVELFDHEKRIPALHLLYNLLWTTQDDAKYEGLFSSEQLDHLQLRMQEAISDG